MSNVVTLGGDKLRTVEDVLHELNEKVAAGEIKHLMVVATGPNDRSHLDWSNQSMREFAYMCSVVQHNLMSQLGGTLIHEE